jgi:hypothetical protein
MAPSRSSFTTRTISFHAANASTTTTSTSPETARVGIRCIGRSARLRGPGRTGAAPAVLAVEHPQRSAERNQRKRSAPKVDEHEPRAMRPDGMPSAATCRTNRPRSGSTVPSAPSGSLAEGASAKARQAANQAVEELFDPPV